ncbi:hypothetical protein [Komagataeibacter sp. FNDCR2]|uniref:hypothetical protein n=1 Tax=Komagataeibacter sp. FNDCR2 TaxID=2878682 RepID=UPI001E34A459|nr:hypothetical protein [Komagataeibacter sp. FNDCR2]MCE2575243.1 hypothetical protein [Komagataeibacter sp. FNDCR2]
MRREDLERHVFDAWRHHLMGPDLFTGFSNDFTIKMNRPRQRGSPATRREVRIFIRREGLFDIAIHYHLLNKRSGNVTM